MNRNRRGRPYVYFGGLGRRTESSHASGDGTGGHPAGLRCRELRLYANQPVSSRSVRLAPYSQESAQPVPWRQASCCSMKHTANGSCSKLSAIAAGMIGLRLISSFCHKKNLLFQSD